MLCSVCKSEKSVPHAIYGYLPGKNCQARRKQFTLPDHPVEMVGESIKSERKEFGSSIVQPFRSDGTFSEEYYQAHGTKGVKVTEEQVKKRKRIWDKAVSINYDIKQTK